MRNSLQIQVTCSKNLRAESEVLEKSRKLPSLNPSASHTFPSKNFGMQDTTQADVMMRGEACKHGEIGDVI